MSDKDFIKDVIYGLKIEYGEPVTFRKETNVVNLDTGNKTTTVDQFIINKAIPLPINLRASFLKTIGISKLSYLEPGQREILIDKSDIPATKEIKLHNRVIINGATEEIVKFDDYDFAMIAVTKSY